MKSNQRWTRAATGVMVAALAALATVGAVAVSAGAAAPMAVRAAAATTPPWEPDNNAVFGGIDFYNAAGQQITGGSITDAPLAAYAIAEHTSTGATLATLFGYLPKNGQNSPVGTGFVDSFQGEQLSDSTAFPNSAAVAGIAALSNPVVTGLSSDETLQVLETDFPNRDTSTDGFAGMYQLRMKLSSPAGGTATGYASTDVLITGTTWSQVYGSFASPVSGGTGATSTSTVVTASPVSPTTAGTSVTFTATVTPSSAVGSVQFMDGANTLGSPVAVSGGTATSAATTSLSQSTHSIIAVFTPTSPAAFSASTSPALSYVVNAASGATSTSTVVTASPVSPTTAGTSVTFTATVTPSSAVGSVQFKDGANNLGNAVNVSSGSAVLTTTALTQATHSITAVFTPTSATAFAASTSTALSYVVNASLTAVATTTALAVSPASTAATGAAVQLTATVSCTATCTPIGTVGFWDGGSVQIGATQTVVSGSATVSTTTLSIGSSHSFVAIFTPTDQTAFTTSQSAAVPYSITSTDAGSATLTDSSGTALGSDPTLAPGQTVTVQASGFTAGETVTATVHSVTQTLAPATASSTGTIAYAFTVPTTLPAGAHTLVLAGTTSAHTVTINFSIASPSVLGTTTTPSAGSASLPFTGADIGLLAAVAGVCMCVGFVIRFGAPEPRRAGAHERRGPGIHARMGAKHARR